MALFFFGKRKFKQNAGEEKVEVFKKVVLGWVQTIGCSDIA